MIVVYILIAILMFGLLIAIHELGHFTAAKLLGVRVNEFAIGMGPKLFSRQGKETKYSLRLLPIGGFCAMEGEDEDTEDPRSFQKAKGWKKFIILAAGAFMNFVLGVLIFFILFLGSEQYLSTTIGSFVDDFPPQTEETLMAGDRLLKIDGHRIYLYQDISIFFSRGDPEYLDLTVERDGRKVDLGKVYMPWRYSYDGEGNQYFNEDGSPVLVRGIRPLVKDTTFWDKVKLTWNNSIDTVRLVWVSLGDLVTGKVGLRDLSGVVQITSLMGQAGEQGAEAAAQAGTSQFWGAMQSILNLVAFIAVNLAVMNLLPIPALDGGRIFFLIINGIFYLFTRRKINPKYEGVVNTVGFVLLIALMILIAVSDIFKLFGK